LGPKVFGRLTHFENRCREAGVIEIEIGRVGITVVVSIYAPLQAALIMGLRYVYIVDGWVQLRVYHCLEIWVAHIRIAIFDGTSQVIRGGLQAVLNRRACCGVNCVITPTAETLFGDLLRLPVRSGGNITRSPLGRVDSHSV
jgi:hypothetical protein